MKTKKYLIILILKYLEANSDEKHPLTQTRIAEEISGVFPCDRKTVGRNLRFLKEVGYPIKKTSRGFYLGKRLFTVEEREFVLNAVAAAPGKTQEEKAELSEKLLSVLHRLRR